MPLVPRRFRETGTVESRVVWYLQHGYTNAQIHTAVKKKHPRVRSATIDRHIDYWRSTYRAGTRISRANQNRKLTTQGIPRQDGRGDTLRVDITFVFDNPLAPRGKRRGRRGYTYDVPLGLTPKQVLEQFRELLIEEYLAQYGMDRRTLQRRMRDFTIKQAEIV